MGLANLSQESSALQTTKRLIRSVGGKEYQQEQLESVDGLLTDWWRIIRPLQTSVVMIYIFRDTFSRFLDGWMMMMIHKQKKKKERNNHDTYFIVPTNSRTSHFSSSFTFHHDWKSGWSQANHSSQSASSTILTGPSITPLGPYSTTPLSDRYINVLWSTTACRKGLVNMYHPPRFSSRASHRAVWGIILPFRGKSSENCPLRWLVQWVNGRQTSPCLEGFLKSYSHWRVDLPTYVGSMAWAEGDRVSSLSRISSNSIVGVYFHQKHSRVRPLPLPAWVSYHGYFFDHQPIHHLVSSDSSRDDAMPYSSLDPWGRRGKEAVKALRAGFELLFLVQCLPSSRSRSLAHPLAAVNRTIT